MLSPFYRLPFTCLFTSTPTGGVRDKETEAHGGVTHPLRLEAGLHSKFV